MDCIIRDSKGKFVKGSPSHNKGKHLSKETKQKIREIRLKNLIKKGDTN